MKHAITLRYRGAALLVVLGVLLVASTAIVVLAQIASTTRLQQKRGIDLRNADAAIVATEHIIEVWLHTEAGSVVLSPEVIEPAVNVVNDQIQFDESSIHIQITAWDQCGMLPIQLAQRGSMLRFAAPAEILRHVDEFELDDADVIGLDLFTKLDNDDRFIVFPAHGPTSSVQYFVQSDTTHHDQHRKDSSASFRIIEGEQPALGAILATHLPSPGRININTAPIPLIEQALLEAGRGGLDMIKQHRLTGSAVPLSNLPREDSGDRQSSLQFVGSSSAWSFRVDVNCGIAQCSWWMVYQQRDSGWECVQSLVIDE